MVCVLAPNDIVPILLRFFFIRYVRLPQTKQRMSAQFMEDDEMPNSYDVDDVRTRMRAALRADQVSACAQWLGEGGWL